MNSSEFLQLQPGQVIVYHLPQKDQPLDPARQYHGRILRIWERSQVVEVSLLDTGYEGLTEAVAAAEIDSIEEQHIEET